MLFRSGDKILTLSDADANLKGFALPATSDTAGATAYGKDGYWFNKSDLRAGVRGGSFSYKVNAGVFALTLDNPPSTSYYFIGFRAAKAL